MNTILGLVNMGYPRVISLTCFKWRPNELKKLFSQSPCALNYVLSTFYEPPMVWTERVLGSIMISLKL